MGLGAQDVSKEVPLRGGCVWIDFYRRQSSARFIRAEWKVMELASSSFSPAPSSLLTMSWCLSFRL